MMEVEDGRMMPEAVVKQKGRSSQRTEETQREENIRPEKHEHCPTVSKRTRNPAGFYSKEWDKLQQEDHEWQVPDKWKRISQMVFQNRSLEIHHYASG